jgi:hypothetical protein
MKPIIVKDNKLKKVKWDNHDILNRSTPGELQEILYFRDKEIKKQEEYFLNQRMNLLSK